MVEREVCIGRLEEKTMQNIKQSSKMEKKTLSEDTPRDICKTLSRIAFSLWGSQKEKRKSQKNYLKKLCPQTFLI